MSRLAGLCTSNNEFVLEPAAIFVALQDGNVSVGSEERLPAELLDGKEENARDCQG